MALLGPAEADVRKAFTGAYARRVAAFLLYRGKARAGLGEFVAAQHDLLEAQPLFVETRGPGHKETRECIQALIDVYGAWHSAERGQGHEAQAAEWKRKLDELGS